MRFFLLLALAAAPAFAQNFTSEEQDFRLVKVVEGLDHPWSVAFLPDGGMLVTERPGRLRLVRGGKLQPEPFRPDKS